MHKLSFKITLKLTQSLRELDNLILSAYAELIKLPENELSAIHRYARISNIGSSTRIENALLTDSEINWVDTVLTTNGKINAFEKNKSLFENKLSKDRERSIEEVAGCRSMLFIIYEKAKEFFPLRESDIRALHEVLMRLFLKNDPTVGSYKTGPNYVVEKNHATGLSRVVFKTADAGPITSIAMQQLVSWYNEVLLSEPWTIAVICEFIYRFLAIHPFQDGNGRLGRGLFLLGLLQSDNQALSTVARYVALDRQIEKQKEEYYFVLHACSEGKFSQNANDYKIEYFVNFMLKMLKKSLLDIDVYRQKFAAVQNLSESARKVLSCFKENPQLRLNTSKICQATKLPRRTVVYSVNILLKSHLIQKYGKGAGVRYQVTF